MAIKEILMNENQPYLDLRANKPKLGKPRIGTGFELKEDFYSLIWVYMFKSELLVGKKIIKKDPPAKNPAANTLKDKDSGSKVAATQDKTFSKDLKPQGKKSKK